jgi:DNA topoisomerase-2
LIYHPDDATLYTPLEDDGMVIEPYHYTPIIPMVLVNGAVGIGTGWSTSIPQHNPLDIIKNIEHMLDGIGVNSLVPWYRGFTGTVMKKGDEFVMNGAFNWKSNTCLHITELPVGVWTSGYKEFLEKASAGETKGFKKGMVTRIISNYTDTLVDFNVHCSQDFATILRADRSKVFKLFKLDKKIQMSNMHAFTSEGKIKKYANASAIIDDFFPVRMRLYQERKNAMVLGYQQELTKANQTVKFLQLVLDNTFVFKGQNKNQLKAQLERFKLDNAEFLLQLPIYNLTDEKMAGLLAKKADLEASIRNLQKCSVQSLWKNDLKNLREALQTQPKEVKIRKSSKKRK